MGRRNWKPSSCGSSRWKTATSCLRNRRCWKQPRSTSGSTNRSERMTTSARWRTVSASSCRTGASCVSPCGLRVFEDVKDRHQVRGIAPRRDVADQPVGDARQPDGVPLLDRQVAEGAGDPPGVLDLGTSRRAEVHRAAGVEHEAAAEVRIGLELLDEEPVGPPEGPPVEPPEVVAGDILAVLGELDARPPVRAGVPARDAPLHRLPREQRQGRQPRQDGGSRKLRARRSGNIGGDASGGRWAIDVSWPSHDRCPDGRVRAIAASGSGPLPPSED